MLIPSPRVTDSLTLFLWSCDRCLVLWFAGIPFLFRINMLVATLLIFAVATHPWLPRLLPLFLSIRSVKTIPPHRYLTRAHRRRVMENYEQDQAVIREEMDQMKTKVDA